MDFKTIQEMILTLLPMWNYRLAKPFKQLLDEGVSLEMYYCIKTLEWGGGTMIMSELAHWTKMSKQQMTHMVNRLVEQGFVERVYDPANRRIIKIKLADKAHEYIDHFVEYDASCFRPMLEQMSEDDLAQFQHAMSLLIDVFSHMPCESDTVKTDDDAAE